MRLSLNKIFDVLVNLAPWRNGSVGVLHTLGGSSTLPGATKFGRLKYGSANPNSRSITYSESGWLPLETSKNYLLV